MPNYSGTKDLLLKKFYLWGLLGSAIAAGIFLRLKGLDKAPFTIDEYFIAASVQNILESGFPEFGCGGFYTRGLLYQYILAPLFGYGSNDELYARLVTVASNILTAPALYLLAKQISGKTVAYAVIVLFFLSVWEIEFSRFARMYTPFQMIFIWYIYFLHKWTFHYARNAKAWCYSLSFLSIFIYEGGIFLILLNFLPTFIDRKHFRKSDIAISTAILGVAYAYLTANFRFPGADTITNTANSIVIMPPIMARSLGFGDAWFTLFLILLSIIIFLGIKLIRQLLADRSDPSAEHKVIFTLSLVALSVINAYTLIASFVALSLALNWITLKDLFSRSFFPIIFFITAMLVFWMAYGLLADQWITAVNPERQANAKQVFIALFKYPDVYNKVIDIFFQTMPVFTITTGFILMLGFIEALSKFYSERKDYLFIIAIVIGLVLSLCILSQPYVSTRYMFFLYPLIILLIVMTIQNFAQLMSGNKQKHHLIISGFLIIFMLISEDYNFKHYLNIDKEDILYRSHYNEHMENHLYARWDFRTPAEIVNKNWKPGDIVISSTYATPYYLDHLDYFYNDAGRESSFLGTTGCDGEKNLWCNVIQVSQANDILALINKTNSTVWLIARSDEYRWRYSVEESFEQMYASNKIYQTIDGNLNVYRIP